MYNIHSNHNSDVIKAEYAQYQAGVPTGIMHFNMRPLRSILRSITQPQKDQR